MSDSRGALVQMLFGFFPAQLVQTAAQLGVVDHLTDGPRTADEVAAAVGTDPGATRRLLRALAFVDVVDETEPGTFAAGRHADPLRADRADSIRNLAMLFCGDEVWRSWGLLAEGIRTGHPTWEQVTGYDTFAYMDANPAFAARFNQAMSEGTRAAVPGIVAVGDFARFRTVVDVGGGDGTLLAGVLAAAPGTTGTVFDTASGAAEGTATLADAGVGDRAQVRTGDFFAAVPGGDAHLLKSVVHDWDDDRAVAILSRCREALPAGGVLLVVEAIMPEVMTAGADVGALVMSDLNMLVCAGGVERTESEYRTLLTAAGFDLRTVTPCPGPTAYSVLEAAPTG